MILKVWFDRIWLGYGVQSERTMLVEHTWLRSVLPPYYVGRGIAVRLPGNRSLRFGLCRANNYGDEEEPDIDAELAAAGWAEMEAEAETIRTWKQDETEEEGDQDVVRNEAADVWHDRRYGESRPGSCEQDLDPGPGPVG